MIGAAKAAAILLCATMGLGLRNSRPFSVDEEKADDLVRYRVCFVIPFVPAGKNQLEYPELLKQENLAARFTIFIHLDTKGRVVFAGVDKSQYPDLRKSIEEAMKKWIFQPTTHEIDSIYIASFAQIIFIPEENGISSTTTENDDQENADEYEKGLKEEKSLLIALADYSQKMREGAPDYVCTEKIDETINIVKRELVNVMAVGSGGSYNRNEEWDLIMSGFKKESYLYDYQVIRDKSAVAEKRVLLGKTGDEALTLSYSLFPMTFPSRILSRENRVFYSFRILGEDDIQGKNAICLEVSPRSRKARYSGKIWVEKETGRLLKIEMATNILEGFPEILEECSRKFLKPHFSFSFEYGLERNGLLYPRKAKAKIEYSGFTYTKKDLKAEAEFLYSNYRFFKVATQDEIKK